MNIRDFLALSYILQGIGFIGITLAWIKAVKEFRSGNRFYETRLLLLIITTVAFIAYLFPGFAALCYFITGCFKSVYRDYLRVFSGLILFLFGTAMYLLFYTKDNDVG